MSMSQDELRLECLKLAQAFPTGLSRPAEDIVDQARLYADFVLDHAARPTALPAQPTTPESETDPQKSNVPGHAVTGHISVSST